MSDTKAVFSDPHRLVDPAEFTAFSRKLSSCIIRMAHRPENGGNPFLYCLTSTKPHFLAADKVLSTKIRQATDRSVPVNLPCDTAATDGRRFLWHPDFFRRLDKKEIYIIMMHESLHIAFDHPRRMRHSLARQRNIAMDYVVNACIQYDIVQKQKNSEGIWGGNIGHPILLADFLDHIDGKTNDDITGRIFADISLYKKSPESVYEKIMKHWERSPRKCPSCGGLTLDPETKLPKGEGPCLSRPLCSHLGNCCPTCGSACSNGMCSGGDGIPHAMDGHMDCALSPDEIRHDIMRASQGSRMMAGVSSAQIGMGIEEILGSLSSPQIHFTEAIRSSCLSYSGRLGMHNNYRRYRRTYMSTNPKMYIPTRHSHCVKWVGLLDTSASMGAEEMARGISQLQTISGQGSSGIIVPGDCVPYWKEASKINSVHDLRKTRVVGRGGTLYSEFFRDYRKYLGSDFGCIVVITDGGVSSDDMENCKKYAPRGTPTIWINIDNNGFIPPFGKIYNLDSRRM